MNHIKTVFMLSAISALSACTISGESEFTCPDPESGICTDAHTAFILAQDGKSAADFKNNKQEHNESRGHTDHDHSTDSVNVKNQAQGEHTQYRDVAPIAGLMRMPIDQPKPVLMQATVLEGWVNVWEDQSGTLRLPSSILVEITPRRWSLDGTNIEEFKTQGPFVTTTATE